MIYFKVTCNQTGDVPFERATENELIEWGAEIMQHRIEGGHNDELEQKFARDLYEGIDFEYALHVLDLYDYKVEIKTDMRILSLKGVEQ